MDKATLTALVSDWLTGKADTLAMSALADILEEEGHLQAAAVARLGKVRRKVRGHADTTVTVDLDQVATAAWMRMRKSKVSRQMFGSIVATRE